MATIKQKNKKLATADGDQKNTKAGLKTIEVQAEEQRKKLHYAKIKLATAKQQVMI